MANVVRCRHFAVCVSDFRLLSIASPLQLSAVKEDLARDLDDGRLLKG